MKRIFFDPTGQILNMGGPYIGKLFIDGNELVGNYLVDNFIVDNSSQMLFVVRYIDSGYFQWQVKFKIQAISLLNGNTCFSKRSFKAICLVEIAGGMISFFEVFCEGNKQVLKNISFTEEYFRP